MAPFVNAARFSGAIRGALEASLGRSVSFEAVHFTLFAGPGFSLERVTIAEDPRYGIEPFAFVPVVEARVRLDQLLFGRLRFTNLRLDNPSLNLVRGNDGSWNIVALVQRLSAPRQLPLNFFPALEVSDGRIDFKIGARKNTLYISESGLRIYPQRSGKVYLRFSGSPARTDRAGMGFGRFRGSASWYLRPQADGRQLDAEVFLDPSNLSELTTLIEGHDLGIHGTLQSQLAISGPASALKVTGALRLTDVHRWDLLPASGEEWTVKYGGSLDLLGQRLELSTLTAGEATPVSLQLHANDLLARMNSQIVANLRNAPVEDLLPLVSRLGLAVPSGAQLKGMVSGSLGYANDGGWSGHFTLAGGEAALADAPVLRAATTEVMVRGDHLHLGPATLAAGSGSGTLRMSADYFFSPRNADVAVSAHDVPLADFKPLASSWLGGAGPVEALRAGSITGQFNYTHASDDDADDSGNAAAWSGQFTFSDASLAIPGLPLPVDAARGHVIFSNAGLTVDHLSGQLAGEDVRADYRFASRAKRPEEARVEFGRLDLTRLGTLLNNSRGDAAGTLWSRLRFWRRSTPGWLSRRNLEATIVVDELVAGDERLGSLNTRVLCEGTSLNVRQAALQLPEGRIDAAGTVNLAAFEPQWRFTARASDYPWASGSLDAEGEFSSRGAGRELLENLTATGSFTGREVALSSHDTFDTVAGQFRFSFAENWPDLRFSEIRAVQNGDQWEGEGATESDGKLRIDLAHAGQQLHLVSTLRGGSAAGGTVQPARLPVLSTTFGRGLKFK